MSGSLRAARGWKLAIERNGYCVRVSADDVQTLAGTAEPATGLGNDPSCRPLPDGGPLRLTLYGVATTPGAGTSIVVLANGMVIAGVAVAPETWLRTLVATRQEDDPMRGLLLDLAERARNAPEPQPDEIEHVHLINATVLAGTGPLRCSGTWQIPLAHVAGWTYGPVGSDYSTASDTIGPL
jgi:hypothetical protein